MEQRLPDFTPQVSKNEAKFLQGPHSRFKELLYAIDVFKEFIYGFRKLHFIGPCITVYGSARFPETNVHYAAARKIGEGIARLGFTTITGGGPGIMEAANRGAKEGGGYSVGCNIVLPKEQKPNPYLDKWIDIDYFFLRKLLLSKYSYAIVVMPGGYGTLDEFFENVTLMQTGKMVKLPIVLFGTEYHEALYKHMHKMIAEQTIDAKDIELFLFTDSIEDAIQHINVNTPVKSSTLKPMAILGERK